jgi:hypothetical protein
MTVGQYNEHLRDLLLGNDASPEQQPELKIREDKVRSYATQDSEKLSGVRLAWLSMD